MPRLDPPTRNFVVGRLHAGHSQNEVARNLNVSQSTISRLWNIFLQTGSSNDRPRGGRPRIVTPGQDRYIWVFHLHNRTVSASTTAVGIHGLRRISSNTVHNRLRQHGIRLRRPYFGVLLTPLHRSERVRWCNRLRGWTFWNWCRIWFRVPFSPAETTETRWQNTGIQAPEWTFLFLLCSGSGKLR
jgi:transposase